MTDPIKIFPHRKLMLTIAGGHEIPWPETLSSEDFAWPKDYRMNNFPKTAAGEIRYDIPGNEYLFWLADYLPRNLPPLTGEQQKFFEEREQHHHLNGFWLGDLAGQHDAETPFYPNYEYPADFLQTGDISAVTGREYGYTYQDYVESEADILNPGERLMSPEELIFDDFGWHLVLTEERKQFARYWPKFDKLDNFDIASSFGRTGVEPADAGWRVYLGMALQLITSKDNRIEELIRFYHEWEDTILK